MSLKIYKYPSQCLETVSTEFNFDNDAIPDYDNLVRFEQDMIALMLKEQGLGLAANQIGITKRFFAIGHDSFDTFQKPVIIWNPRILNKSEVNVIDVEGCLSFPGIFVKIERPKEIEVQYETTERKTRFAKLIGMEAKCFQHELDHLEGITFNKRVSKLKWDMATKRSEKQNA